MLIYLCINVNEIGAECERVVKEKHVFNYYVGHNDRNGVMKRLTSGLPPIENTATCPFYIIHCSSMLSSTNYLNQIVLDELAR